jgi:hypothetical protein
MGVVIAGSDGQIHKTTLGEQDTHDIVGQLPMLSALARNMVRELDPQDELEFLRVRSLKHEIMVAPSECAAWRWTQLRAAGPVKLMMRCRFVVQCRMQRVTT